MPLEFQGSLKPTLGIEIELQIINPETYDLYPESEKLLETCQKQGLERVKMEIHQSMLEIDTEISENIQECRHYLKSRINELYKIADSLSIALAVGGTHPFQKWKHCIFSNDERYHNLYQKYQWLARRMNVYGLHVHVGMPSGDHALAVSRSMVAYLPHLLALSANSPFWQGIDTGMHSSRINIMESFPFGGLPYLCSNWKELEHYHDTLNRVGAIASLKDLYWYIRPNPHYGTIEFRICDTMPTLEETLAIVALIQCLVVQVSEKSPPNSLSCEWSMEHQWIAPENQWIAARDGLDGMIIVDLHGKRQKISEGILELVEQLQPIANNLNCLAELNQIKNIVNRGNGASLQRAIFNKTNSLKDVVAHSINCFREALN